VDGVMIYGRGFLTINKLNMKLIKYFLGSLIISFGILIVLLIVSRSVGITMPDDILYYLLLAWVSLSVLIFPFAKKIVRVE